MSSTLAETASFPFIFSFACFTSECIITLNEVSVKSGENQSSDTAEQLISDGEADAVSFGKDLISNADLVRRLKLGAALTPYNMDTFYGCMVSNPVEGYLDYPLLKLEC